MNVMDLWNMWNFKIILNWLYGIYNWCHGFIIYMGHVHPIAQTHNSSMDVLHVSFRHDIFSYERKGSATYGNAKWELGSQLNKIFPSPRIFLNSIWILRLLEISSISKRKNVKCQTLKYTYVILSFSQAVIFLNLWFFFVTCDHEDPSFVWNMTLQILWEISKCVTIQTRNRIWSFSHLFSSILTHSITYTP
jgi:hypothetical protein